MVQEHEALSADNTLDPEDITSFPLEFLNTITPEGLPPHKLRLKVGIPVMLVRNLDQAGGKANGTDA